MKWYLVAYVLDALSGQQLSASRVPNIEPFNDPVACLKAAQRVSVPKNGKVTIYGCKVHEPSTEI